MFLVALLGGGSARAQSTCSVRAGELTCDYESAPLGIDDIRPALGWKLVAVRDYERDLGQSAFRIVAASSAERCRPGRADLWDSGKVGGSESVGVHYAGKPLRSGRQVYWRVRVWDQSGKPSAWSDVTGWEMGLLKPTDWKGPWIGSPDPEPATDEARFDDHPAPLFRRAFDVPREVKSARLYVSGLGFYELHLNGEYVGDRVLEPGWTSYAKRVPYSTYNVTAQLHEGRNALAAMLGNGWYDPLPLKMWGHLNLRDYLTIGKPCLRVQLNVEFKNGSHWSLGTDGSWRAAEGPILRNSIYLGEVYDSTREVPGWDLAVCDESGWKSAVPLKGPPGLLTARIAPPIRIHGIIHAKKVSEPKDGVYIVDFGREFAGWMELRTTLRRSTRVTMRYGELLNADKTLNPLTSVAGQIKNVAIPPGSQAPSTAWQTDAYIANGISNARYTPRFTWHGFRYAEVTGLPSKPSTDQFTGVEIYADVPESGTFQCSNDLLNRIHRMARRTFQSNLMSVQSDCPHRERFGYGGDMVATADSLMLNFDMSRFYTKVCQDYQDAARPNGGLTETAPFVGIADAGLGGDSGPVEWGTALPWLMWRLYGYYGDRAILARHYDAAKRWVDLLLAHSKDGILDNGIGDHETLAPKSIAVTGTAFLWDNCTLLALSAYLIDRRADYERYLQASNRIERAFETRFVNSTTGKVDTGTQADQATALHFGLVAPGVRHNAVAALLEDVAAHDHHLTTGIFGTLFLLQSLSASGHSDEAFRIVTQRTYPGWGYMLENGASTLWEHWAFSDNTYSHNHPMFGSVDEWLMEWILGIEPDPYAVGFDRIVIRPQPVGDLTSAHGSLATVRGTIYVNWSRKSGKFTMALRIPPNTRARVYLPTSTPASIGESGKPLSASRRAYRLNRRSDATVVEVGSGSYNFECANVTPH